MRLPPPRSTLFPYTTLFRSVVRLRLSAKAPADPFRTFEETFANRLADADEFYERDRKSTRLNSSHTVISYAVFCLKKKINNSDYLGCLDAEMACTVAHSAMP